MLKKLWNVMVYDVELESGKLIVLRKKREAGKTTYMLTTIFAGVKPQIKNTNGKLIKLSDVKPMDRATMDYRIQNGMLVASKIIIGKYER